ncbi:MAG: hypothetical protein O7G84_13630 [Gammaproteobacteria bacterium]|nr:hypothetical protein [Gammaproteobacteria bacterium]
MPKNTTAIAMQKLRDLLSDESREECEDARSLYDLLKDAGEQFRAVERALLETP